MATQPRKRSSVAQTVGLVGDSGVGKTTVATLLADRLRERSAVRVRGEAATFVEDSYRAGRLGIEWTVIDCAAGPAALAARAENLDTAFVVTTPDNLDRVAAYEQVAAEHDLDCWLVVNRFTEDAREQLRAFEGLELAEYFYENEAIAAAMAAGDSPTLEDWTVEAILMEALQPERTEQDAALEALEASSQQIVNVEVTDKRRGNSLLEMFETAGYDAAYFECNCRCHDGHVLARRSKHPAASKPQPVTETDQPTSGPKVSR